MRIQTIQSANNNKTNFKARFINDKNGYFQELWETAVKSQQLFVKAKHFSQTHPNDSLEIVGIKKCEFLNDGYEILNHNTGAKSLYKIVRNTPKYGILQNLLDLIDKDQHLFDNDTSSMIYNLLLGKK